MNDATPARAPLRLNAARACAWALLIAGWIGIGSFAMALAPGVANGFALVARGAGAARAAGRARRRKPTQ